MEIKSIREFLSWVDQKVFFLDENEGSVCLKNGEKAEDSLIEPYTMKLLISDIKKHSYLWEKHDKEGCHAIAWFPEQIKSVYNQNPLSGRKINQ